MAAPELRASCDDRLTYTVTWSRYRGALYGTIILKASLAMHSGHGATLVRPHSVAWCDSTRPSGAIEHADESSPFSGGGAVLVHGFLYAQGATPRDPVIARLVVGAEQPVIDKVIASERAGKVPLAWEYALRTSDNPVGTDQPVLVDPRDPNRAAGFSPIAPSWVARVQHLPAPIGVRDNILELPDRVDPRFFNPAPRDQQCAPFRGIEGIVLVNLVSGVREFRTWLPKLSVAGRLRVDGSVLPPAAFHLDTLSIDAEARLVHVVWRTVIALTPTTKLVELEATLSGVFEAPPAVVEPPQTQQLPVQREEPAPAPEPAAPARPVRVLPTEPRTFTRIDDARSLMARAAAGGSLEDLDLAGVDLHGLDLSGRSLARSKLDGANLSGTKLIGSNLWATSMVGAELVGASLDGADLEDADLSKVKAQKASFARAILLKARLVGARLDDAVLDDADLSDADATGVALMGVRARRAKANRAKLDRCLLVGADLQDAWLDFATLGKSSLDEANFAGASLADADLTQCATDRANFVNARLARAKLTQSRFTSAQLTGADLTGANLERANLERAHLDKAILDHAVMKGAKLAQANLNGASLQGTDLSDADLTNARLIGVDRTKAILVGAKLVNVQE